MANEGIEELEALIVSDAPPGEDVEVFVRSTLEFKRNGMKLPNRPFSEEEIQAMRQTWTK